MVIELDIGNSRIKWRVRSDNEIKDAGTAANSVELLSVFQALDAPNAVLMASVRDDRSLSEIAKWIKDNWQLTAKRAQVTDEAAGVRNSYHDVTRMGVDRWLAMLAAFQRSKSACLVVDSGTALTIDAIDDGGRHLGGFILPGLGLGIATLESNTGIRLQEKAVDSAQLELGDNTDSAVLNGLLAQAVALIEKTATQLNADPTGHKVPVILSGGDASALQKALADSEAISVEICPTLVLDGLALAETQELN